MMDEEKFKKPEFLVPSRKSAKNSETISTDADGISSTQEGVTSESSGTNKDGRSELQSQTPTISETRREVKRTDEEIEEDNRKETIARQEKYLSLLSKLKYQIPPKASSFDPRYTFEVLKNGLIVDRIEFKPDRSFYVIGRNTQCDIQAEHPTLSRMHAIFQFIGEGDETNSSTESSDEVKESESGTEDCKEKGLYIYDLNSTHGTFLNKNRVFPNRYYRLRVGHVIKFGSSTRLYVVLGPSEDEEEESEKTVTELLKEKLEKDFEKKRQAEIRKNDVGNADVEVEGISWGMGEDAVEEETDLSVNPFATGFEEASDLSLDNPKKTLRSWFDREGYELVYDVKEKSSGHFICRINLPLDGPSGAAVFAEVELKGKKKEVVAQCALKACQVLDKYGALRQSHQEGFKRKSKDWEEKDYYSSDEDTYLDRTGAVERKRENRMKQAGKIEEKTETFQSLTEKYNALQKEMDSLNMKIEKAIRKNEQDESEVDPLDAFMMDLKTGASDIKKLKAKLKELTEEQTGVKKLLNIVTPAVFVPPKKIVASSSSNVKSNDETKGVVVPQQKSEEGNEEEPSAKKIKLLFGPRKPLLQPSDAQKKLAGTPDSNPPASSSSTLSSTVEEEDSEDEEPQVDHAVKPNVVPEYVKEDGEDEDPVKTLAENQGSSKKRRKRNRQQYPKKVTQYEYDSNNPHYSVWVPPEDQRGDGKTKLNEKLGY